MADTAPTADIVDRLNESTPYGLDDPHVLGDAVAEIVRLRLELVEALTVLRHYRTRPHQPTEWDGYVQPGPVSTRAADRADQLLRTAVTTGLMTRRQDDIYA